MIEQLQENKLFLGIMVILLNLGSRHIVDELSSSEEEYRRNLVLRRIAVFAMCFVTTRDLITSLLLTAGFIILATGVSKRAPMEGMSNKKDSDVNKAYDTKEPPMFLTA